MSLASWAERQTSRKVKERIYYEFSIPLYCPSLSFFNPSLSPQIIKQAYLSLSVTE